MSNSTADYHAPEASIAAPRRAVRLGAWIASAVYALVIGALLLAAPILPGGMVLYLLAFLALIGVGALGAFAGGFLKFDRRIFAFASPQAEPALALFDRAADGFA